VSDGVHDAVQVNFSGQVCNTGPDQLTSVTIADSPAAATISPSSPFTLNPGACQPYTGNYLPASSAIATGDLGGIPGRYFFTDTIR
jgi:hypothetical protein